MQYSFEDKLRDHMLVSKVDIRNNIEENLVLNSILVAGYIAVILDE